MKLIIISSDDFFEKETDLLCLLFQEGLQYFHFRKPMANIDEMRKVLNKIPDNFHNKIILHSHYNLINEFNLKGIHLTEKTKKEFQIYKSIKCQKSISCHSINEYNSLESNFSYAFLSPVFDSISKLNYKSKFSEETLHFFFHTKKINIPIIALGGLSLNNIKIAKDYGFNGIALLGNIWKKNLINDKHKFVSYFKLIQQECL